MGYPALANQIVQFQNARSMQVLASGDEMHAPCKGYPDIIVAPCNLLCSMRVFGFDKFASKAIYV